MKSELRIRTPEGIAFSYPLAGPVARCMAWSVDLAVILALVLAMGRVFAVLSIVSRDIAGALSTISYFIVSIGYGVVTEWAWRGQTVGKRIMRLRVMDAQGLRLQPHQILMRNLLRAADMLPFFYLVGGLATVLSQRAQRLGDLAANTVVVHIPKHAEPDLDQLLAGKFNSFRQFPHLEARLRQRATPEEARLALQALVRRDDLEPDARVRLFADLAEHFKTLTNFPPEATDAMPDEQYIRNVVDILFRQRASAPGRSVEKVAR
ncbi:MAG: RDD family protein [Chthoniobacter sp.]|nr:RDD family protein [Chthoniobacter sp.]